MLLASIRQLLLFEVGQFEVVGWVARIKVSCG